MIPLAQSCTYDCMYQLCFDEIVLWGLFLLSLSLPPQLPSVCVGVHFASSYNGYLELLAPYNRYLELLALWERAKYLRDERGILSHYWCYILKTCKSLLFVGHFACKLSDNRKHDTRCLTLVWTRLTIHSS
jgi:hypothetical protein